MRPSRFIERGQLMANTTSAKKMTRKIAKRTMVNRSRRSRMRTFLRKVEEAIAGGDQTVASQALRAAEPELMRAAQKGIVHKNTRVAKSFAAGEPDPAARRLISPSSARLLEARPAPGFFVQAARQGISCSRRAR
jgi:small subunit ribosomal protein S20